MQTKLKLLLLGILLYCPGRISAQNSTNYMQIITNSSLNFYIDSPSDLETAHTKYNALTVRVRTKSKSCHVSARISNYSVPAGFYPTSSPIQLDFTSTTASNASYIYSGPLALNVYDQLLFAQYKNGSTYNYYYNVIMGPLDYSYVPGNYSFTILFTMVQP